MSSCWPCRARTQGSFCDSRLCFAICNHLPRQPRAVFHHVDVPCSAHKLSHAVDEKKKKAEWAFATKLHISVHLETVACRCQVWSTNPSGHLLERFAVRCMADRCPETKISAPCFHARTYNSHQESQPDGHVNLPAPFGICTAWVH